MRKLIVVLMLGACAGGDRAIALRRQIRARQGEPLPALLSRARWGASQQDVIARRGQPLETRDDRIRYARAGDRGCVEEVYDFAADRLVGHRCVHDGPASEVDRALTRLLGPALRSGAVEQTWLTADRRVQRWARGDGKVEITDEPVPGEVLPAPGVLPL